MSRLAAVLLGACCIVGCSRAPRLPVTATVLSAEGRCVLESPRASAPLSTKLRPASGDLIQTGADGRARIALLPNALVQLEPDTEVTILELAVERDGNETEAMMRNRIARLALRHGRLLLEQERRDIPAEAVLRIETRQGSAQSNFDCLFGVEATGRTVRVTCASGWTYFQPSGSAKAERVRPGFVLESTATLAAKMETAETRADSQEVLMDLAAANQNLIRLRDELADAAPPWKVALGR